MPKKETVKVIKELKEERVIPVRVIVNQRGSALVEYMKNGKQTRATIPSKQIVRKRVKEIILDRAVKYGIDWTELNFPSISPEEIHKQLRNHGIWTAQDARMKPGQVTAALQKVCGVLATTIFDFIKDK